MLELLDIRKRFGDVVALDGVTLRLRPGSIHGVLGENGAGKSTLMHVAYGMLRPDAGRLRVNGGDVRFRSPADAIAAGVGMVHQHFMLAGAMTVLDNVLLGDRRESQFVNRRHAAEMLTTLAARLGLPVEPHARVDSLSVGQQQRVEILKALWRDARILILDEPTAVLTPHEAGQLFTAAWRLRDEGRSVVFISHKLNEVKAVCDDLTVLRRGRIVWQGDASQVGTQDLAGHMMGGTGKLSSLPVASDQNHWQASELDSAALRLEHVTTPGLTDVSVAILPGQILGIAGVDGNGQQELAEIVVGLRRPTTGRIVLTGENVSPLSFKQRQARGIAHIPNDRKREALVSTMSITENLALKRHDRPPCSRAGLMDWRYARITARRLATDFDIRTPSVDTPVGALSGGNQQKVVLARELALIDPKLIVAMNPSRGLDVAATRFVHEQLLARRDAGAAILLIDSDLDELLTLCDRVAVLYAGRLTMTNFPNATRDEIGKLMAGVATDRVAS